jgi:predicted transcriptional regulator
MHVVVVGKRKDEMVNIILTIMKIINTFDELRKSIMKMVNTSNDLRKSIMRMINTSNELRKWKNT